MKRLLLFFAPLLAALLLPARAQAHAHLTRADLAPNSHLKISVGTVRFWFDEPLNPALSRIAILNAAGTPVNVDSGQVGTADGTEISVTVPTLPDGLYSVRWTSDSAQDGHIMHGFYVFWVGGPGAHTPAAVPPATGGAAGASLDAAAISIAVAHWLALAASMLWSGALALEVLVLRAARRGSGGMGGTMFIAGRVSALVITAIAATLGASFLELETLAYAAAGGWSGITSASVWHDLLNSRYGAWFAARLLLALAALLAVAGQPSTARSRGAGSGVSSRFALPRLDVPAALALAYLAAFALSGHAAAVPQLTITAVALDWLHLIASAIWIGGIASIALTLAPTLSPAPAGWWPEDGRRALFLDLLDHFSPAAYLALVAAAFTGMFNAQVRLTSWSALTDSTYGRLLLIKLALIGAIAAVSASHVFALRPRLRAHPPTETRDFAILALCIRVEAALGAGVLLCVALMGQVAPGTAFTATVVQVVNDQSATPVAAPLAMTSRSGDLTVTLRLTSADVGQARFAATVAEHGVEVADAQVRIRLDMPANPALGAAFVETTPAAGGYAGDGDLVQEGVWSADVLVRTRSDPEEYRAVPFVFVAGPEPANLRPPFTDTRDGPAVVRLAGMPGAGARLAIRLRAGLAVRYRVTMPDMNPEQGPLQPRPGGWYEGPVVPPMDGYMNITVEVRAGRVWRAVRVLLCQVDGNYDVQLIQ